MQKKYLYDILMEKEDIMNGYVLVEDILDEMSQNITYIKLRSYIKERGD